MYYLLAPALQVPVIQAYRALLTRSVPVKLILTQPSLRSATEILTHNLTASDATYYLDLLPDDGGDPVENLQVDPQWLLTSPTPQVREYSDADGQCRLRETMRTGVIWRRQWYTAAGELQRNELFDARGFLATVESATTRYEYSQSGHLLVQTNLNTHHRQVHTKNGNRIVSAQTDVVAAALDDQFMPGDVVFWIWAHSQHCSAIAHALSKPFLLQSGLVEDHGVIQEFSMLRGIYSDYQKLQAQSHERYLAGEKFYGGNNTDRDYEYGLEVAQRLEKLSGAAANRFLRDHIGAAGNDFNIVQPIYFNTAKNLCVGERFFANRGTYFQDDAQIVIGDNAKIGPNCGFYTGGHPLNPRLRNGGWGQSQRIQIGHNLWMGGGASVLGGVSLGNNVVIAAGAVVIDSFGDNVVLAGVPARIVKRLNVDNYDY